MTKIEGCLGNGCKHYCGENGEDFEVHGDQVLCPAALALRAKRTRWFRTIADRLRVQRENPNSGERNVG